MEVFWEHGFEATSLADLTAAMGINPPSLYAAFGDKEKLFMEAVERYQRRRREQVNQVFEEAPTAREAIERFLTLAATEFACASGPRGCMVIMAATNCSAASAHVQSALAERRTSSRANLKARIDRGVADGDLPAGTETGALADFYATVLEGMAFRSRDGATRKTLLAIAQAAMRAWPRSVARSPKKRTQPHEHSARTRD